MSKIEEAVIQQIRDRADAGQKKYGTTMERNDLSFIDWLNHLQQELLDAAIYVEKLKEKTHQMNNELLPKFEVDVNVQHRLLVEDCFKKKKKNLLLMIADLLAYSMI